ncbi:MAG TPA: hypothetical protein VGU46_09955 [Acidobacteriaceae bacterium]|nr:hypothetical protein [Acidobacteriaceae bacterium]
MFRSFYRFTSSIAAAALLLISFSVASSANAQRPRRVGHETNVTRQLRIDHQIHETYTHRWEVGGGGGYLRFRSGEFTQKNSEITFWMNTTYFLNPKLGITGEVRGAYGNAKVPGGNPFANFVGNPQISEYPLLAGPTYRFREKEKYAVSAFALGGVAIGKFDGASHGISAAQLGFWPSTSARPAFSLGANLDLNLYPNLAFRIAPSYLGTTFGGKLENNMGFEMGLVYRFGRQK